MAAPRAYPPAAVAVTRSRLLPHSEGSDVTLLSVALTGNQSSVPGCSMSPSGISVSSVKSGRTTSSFRMVSSVSSTTCGGITRNSWYLSPDETAALNAELTVNVPELAANPDTVRYSPSGGLPGDEALRAIRSQLPTNDVLGSWVETRAFASVSVVDEPPVATP